ncbi:inner membrane protein YpjD [Psychrosphaera saromensis]|nr:cytochrome c biogenesis protein CcsA [Psychrosphaera saromensis]GHB64675.1 inner membrane protein YpjD [Psychrosphaera saromensis]GLQ15737.1 inner membrane protein YpjD [Psychrosphaera saromensis]
MSVMLGLNLAFIGFTLASFITARTIFLNAKFNSKVLFSVAIAAIIFQLFAVRSILFVGTELHLSLAAMCVLINALIAAVLTIRSFTSTNLMILFVTYCFSALLSLAVIFIPHDSLAYMGVSIDSSTPLIIHIVLSVSAYCVLVISSLYAVQFRYIDAKLKSKTLSLNSHLPSLNIVEAQQFRLMFIGLLLLTAALVTGLLFLDNMWAKQYAHKTILSIIAWAAFATLAIGHKLYGWRGRNSAIGTILASVILTLAYFGSRFVREILLT